MTKQTWKKVDIMVSGLGTAILEWVIKDKRRLISNWVMKTKDVFPTRRTRVGGFVGVLRLRGTVRTPFEIID